MNNCILYIQFLTLVKNTKIWIVQCVYVILKRKKNFWKQIVVMIFVKNVSEGYHRENKTENVQFAGQ